MEKPKCYNCKYRKNLDYSAHSQCIHPLMGGEQNNIVGLALYLNGFNPLKIKGSQHGIENGWFMYPINFDPVWLENCIGFKEKQMEVSDENATSE